MFWLLHCLVFCDPRCPLVNGPSRAMGGIRQVLTAPVPHQVVLLQAQLVVLHGMLPFLQTLVSGGRCARGHSS